MDTLITLLRPGLVVPIVAILAPVAILAIVVNFVHRQQERRHQMIVNLLERGLPVPPELLVTRRMRRAPGSQLARALALIGAGAGISAFLYAMFGTERGIWACGLIPLCVGVALLVAIRLERPPRDAESRAAPAPSGEAPR